MKNVIMIVVIAAMSAMCGCKSLLNESDYAIEAVVIGVENGFAGKCAGAARDADNMSELLSKYTDDITVIKSADATKENVVNALKSVDDSSLMIVFYSGHGGRQSFNDDKTKFEADGYDEYLCLKDTYLRDDEIWDIISVRSGRTVLIFDCCHSETMFRSSWPFMVLNKRVSGCSKDSNVRMLCWSGCPDDKSSYGSFSGGYFTNTILKYWKADKTYSEMWMDMIDDTDLSKYEIIQRTVIGEGFDGKVFQ